MRRITTIITTFLAFALAALPLRADEPQSFAEDKVVEFIGGKTFDFGDILLSDGAVSCKFTFRNIADFPITVLNIISSCGCTTPVWTRGEIAPGKTGNIDITFTNDQGPYPFDKTLTVYISRVNRPVMLHVRGISHEKNKPLAQLFPEHVAGLGLRTTGANIGNIPQGQAKADRAAVANLTGQEMTVEIADATPGLTLKISPNPIKPRSTATMLISVDTRLLPDRRWGREEFTARFIVNGKLQEQKYTVRGFIREDFASLSDRELKEASKPSPEQSYFEFGTVSAGTTVKASYKIKNTGKSTLVIHKVEFESGEGASGSARVTTACPLTIKPGATATLNLILKTDKLSGEVLDVLTLVTNSPHKPLLNLFLTGNVK